MFFSKKTRPPQKKHVFLLNQGSAAYVAVGIAAQFYHRTKRQRLKDDQSAVFCNALLCAHSYDKLSSFKIINKVINVPSIS